MPGMAQAAIRLDEPETSHLVRLAGRAVSFRPVLWFVAVKFPVHHPGNIEREENAHGAVPPFAEFFPGCPGVFRFADLADVNHWFAKSRTGFHMLANQFNALPGVHRAVHAVVTRPRNQVERDVRQHVRGQGGYAFRAIPDFVHFRRVINFALRSNRRLPGALDPALPRRKEADEPVAAAFQLRRRQGGPRLAFLPAQHPVALPVLQYESNIPVCVGLEQIGCDFVELRFLVGKITIEVQINAGFLREWKNLERHRPERQGQGFDVIGLLQNIHQPRIERDFPVAVIVIAGQLVLPQPKLGDLHAEPVNRLRYNSEWLAPMRLADVIKLCSQMSVARMMERDTFEKRYKAGEPISIHEFLYPLMQGYDSVCIQSDVELGGTDQTFNNLVGRQLQTGAGQQPQIVMIMPILPGLDGVHKMSKSLGNYIGVSEPPNEVFGKAMSISDELMWPWYEMLLGKTQADIAALKTGHPMEAKKALAAALVERLHNADAARAAREHFDKQFSKKNLNEIAEPLALPAGRIGLIELVEKTGAFKSRSDIRRVIQEGGVQLDGQKFTDPKAVIEPRAGQIVRAGKRVVRKIELLP